MKNQKEKILVGLDIGTTKICVIVAKEVAPKRIEILGKGQVVSRGVEDGEVRNILQVGEDIQRAVAIAEERSGYKIKEVFVGVAGAQVKSSTMRLGITRPNPNELISKSDIDLLYMQAKNIVTNPVEKIISCQPQEFFVDNKPATGNNPIGMRGNRLEANWHLIIGNTTPSENIAMAVEDIAKLKILNMDLEPLASAESVLSEEELKEGVCLIDIGGGTTDIAIFSKGIIRHTAIIPYAGEYITSIIREKLKLTETAAKNLKEDSKATSALYTHVKDNVMITLKNLSHHKPLEISKKMYCQLVNACLEQIFGLIKNEIHSSYFKNELNAGIVITGGGANIPDLVKFVEQYIGIPTQIGRPLNYIQNLKDETSKSMSNTMYATAIGLVLLAAKEQNADMVYQPNSIDDQTEINTPDEETVSTKTSEETQNKKPEKAFNHWTQRLTKKLIEKTKEFMIEDEEIKDFED